MHELSIAQGILDIVQQHVPPERLASVVSVRVRLGRLSGVVSESLSFCFDALVAETPFRRARLEIEHVATRCACLDCGASFEPEALVFFCPSCRSGRVRLVSGNDLQVVHVELGDVPRSADVGERRLAPGGGG